jgi:hypothetical protein
LGDVTGYSDSKMPMNINPHLWKAILGRDNADLNNPKNNIAAAAILLKRLEKSVKGEKDAAKIGTLWNSAGQSETTDFGEYIGRLYQDKPWLKPDPLEGDQNEPEGP